MIQIVALMALLGQVAQAEEVVYGVFKKECVEKEEYTSGACLQFTGLKLLGYLIVVAAFCLKLPQLTLIIKSGSVKGISVYGAQAELLMYFNTLAYALHLGLPLSVYGETILITVGNAFVVLAIFWYDRKIVQQKKMLFVGCFIMYATLLLNDSAMSDYRWWLVSSSCIVLSAIARGSQFYINWKNDSTGQLSGASLGFQAFISAARLTTVLMTQDDFMYRLQYIMGFCFVMSNVLQFIALNYLRIAPKRQVRRASTQAMPRRGGSSVRRNSQSPRKSRATTPRRSSSPSKRTASPRKRSPAKRQRSPSPKKTK